MKFNSRFRSQTNWFTYVVFFALSCFIYDSIVYASESESLVINSNSIPQEYKRLHQAALAGSAEAQFKLGLLYEYGRGVDQNDSIATIWYEKSAAQGFSSAQYRLAVLYDNGWGKAINKELAFELYKFAAENGHELAQHDLAMMYFEGIGTKKSLVHAYKWLRIAISNGSALMQKHLSMVALEMSSYEIKIAEILANEWIERTSI